jgi:hypothetical protein
MDIEEEAARPAVGAPKNDADYDSQASTQRTSTILPKLHSGRRDSDANNFLQLYHVLLYILISQRTYQESHY